MSTIALGIDPDTKSTGWALVERRQSEFHVLDCGLIRAKGRLATDRVREMARNLVAWGMKQNLHCTQLDMIVVEWMHLRPTHKEKNPNAILSVQAIAGMAVAATGCMSPRHLFTPTPPEWKKTMKKESKQRAILRNLRLSEELLQQNGIFIPGAAKLPASMRTHVIDALGLAVWGLDPYGPMFQLELTAKVKARKR